MVSMIVVALASIAGGTIGSPLNAAMAPTSQDIQYYMFSKLPHTKPQPLDLVRMLHQGLIDYKLYLKWMSQYGYDNDKGSLYAQSNVLFNDPNDLLKLKWQGIIDKSDYEKEMKLNGFDGLRSERFEKASKYFPNPRDLITFGVREVFTPKIVSAYKYDEDFPFIDDGKHEEGRKWLGYTGIDPEVMKMYWRAHWNLPAPNQVYAMYLRFNSDVLDVLGDKYKGMGINPDNIKMDLDKVRTYFKTADFPKYWRDRLIALGYPPITRIDLRRIFSMGLINQKELTARLQELGYAKPDADLMTKFYVSYKNSHEKDLTKSMVLKGYMQGIIERKDVTDYLILLGYDENEAELIITLKENDDREKQLKLRIATIKNNYIHGVITKTEAAEKIDSFNIAGSYKEKIISELKETKQRMAKIPDKKDVMTFLANGLISENEFEDYMYRIGYNRKDTQLYLKLIQLQQIGG